MKINKFTIIELLLVISIAGVMLSVAVPAFSRMMKGAASGIAVREIMGKLNAARAYAVANNTHVAVVFPKTTGSDNIVTKRYSYRSYRACEINEENTFQRWIPGENWSFLPNGIIIGKEKKPSEAVEDEEDFIYTTDGNIPSTQTPAPKLSGIKIKERATEISIDGNNAIIFRPDGMLKSFPNGILIRIREGKIDSLTGTLPDGTDIKEYLKLFVQFNGKVKAFNELVED